MKVEKADALAAFRGHRRAQRPSESRCSTGGYSGSRGKAGWPHVPSASC